MKHPFLEVTNGRAVQMSEMPLLAFDTFRQAGLDLVQAGARVVQFFAFKTPDSCLQMCGVYRLDSRLFAGLSLAPDAYDSLTPACEPFHLFEREIAEQFGIRPKGHPWLKMVRYHPNQTDAQDVFGNDYSQDIPGNYPYYQVDGDEIHEVAVGPVHAGVIEPGHFRFNCIGERVLHLEIQLGYQHRAVERLLDAVPAKRLANVVENIAGDTTIGHSLCYAQAVEALTGTRPDQGAATLRVIALELERLANHIGDLGALSGDVAFLPPANYFGRIRGDFLNLSLLLCGNRFGKGLVRPGGVRFDLNDAVRQTLTERLAELKPQVIHVLELLFGASTVQARFDGCGRVSQADARHLGLVGPAGRASGIPYDARRLFPTEGYANLSLPESCEPSGDVFARAKVRYDEVVQSMAIIESLIQVPVKTRVVSPENLPLAKNSFVVTLNEAWRGEVSHVLITDPEGGILRYKVKDPSFHNWNGLAMALRDTGISDFPLNNKSFNLSYCGFDL